MSTIGTCALAYGTGGALVLPLHTPTGTGCSCHRRECGHIGKHPRTMNGKNDATDDADTITRWWAMWPNANIGIRPHPGQVVLDVDPRNGGAAQYSAMLNHFGPLPATRTARTGSGGLHLWFTLHGDVRGQLAPGIDVKTHSGYLVAAPSVHASGRRYEWIDASDIAAAPAWLLTLLTPPAPAPRRAAGNATPVKLAALVRLVEQAPDGELNNRLYWASCRAHECGADTAPLVAAAIAKGHPERGAIATARSAGNAPGRTAAHGLEALL